MGKKKSVKIMTTVLKREKRKLFEKVSELLNSLRVESKAMLNLNEHFNSLTEHPYFTMTVIIHRTIFGKEVLL